MSVDEQTRHGIHTWLVRAIGEQYGDGLMTLLPPTGWADVATKGDLGQLDERLGLRFEMLEQVDRRFDEIDRRFGAVDDRFGSMEKAIIGAVDTKVASTMRAMFFALAALLLTLTTIIVSVVLATR
jgi:hypothetical protein